MALGPGRYDAATTAVRLSTGATTVLVLVEGGIDGDGFEVQTVDPLFSSRLPTLLRTMADEIETGGVDGY